MKIPWIFHQDYDIPLPKNHRFSSSKFGDLYTLLIDTELSKNAEVFIPIPEKEIQLMKVHTQEYINKIKDGNLSMKEEKVLGLPWSETLSKRSYLAVNGTYLRLTLLSRMVLLAILRGVRITPTRIMALDSAYLMT